MLCLPGLCVLSTDGEKGAGDSAGRRGRPSAPRQAVSPPVCCQHVTASQPDEGGWARYQVESKAVLPMAYLVLYQQGVDREAGVWTQVYVKRKFRFRRVSRGLCVGLILL